MTQQFARRLMFAISLVCQFSICLGSEAPDPNQSSRYLDAVREFADNVLKYGRDTYGPKQTPLFVDGLNVNTHEPVKWINSDGYKWVLSNLASQQTLMRTLDGLSQITGDPRYRDAAMQAIRYAFEHLQAPNGLLYCGEDTAYDAEADIVKERTSALKLQYFYYELMWAVDPNATRKFIEAFWFSYILDWSNLDMDRIAPFDRLRVSEGWDHEYKGGPVFFKSKSGGCAFIQTGSSLIHAGTKLFELLDQKQSLYWSKLLAERYVNTRHPNTGISGIIYNNSWRHLGNDMNEHFIDPHTTLFPYNPFDTRYIAYPEDIHAQPWICIFLVGDMLGDEGKEFTQWALEELTAWGKVSYRRKDNSFVPMLTDGTSIEGYTFKDYTSGEPKGTVVKPYFVDLTFFWAYAVAYRTTSDEFMWQMVRDIALGNSFGDIGENLTDTPKLSTDTQCSEVYGLLGFLELYAKTNKPEFLQIAQRIGDNILAKQFHKGFFVPSKRHIYTRFDCFEPLALLHLNATIKGRTRLVPTVWPSSPLFVAPYRYKEKGCDRRYIYSLAESSEPPISLQEAAAVGDISMVNSLLEKGAGVEDSDDPLKTTALQRATINGHREVVALLIVKGARIDSKEGFPGGTALDYAAEQGHKEIAELLIAKGADVNATRGYPAGDRPLHSAARAGHRVIVELLIIHGADVNARNAAGDTPLQGAARYDRKDVIQLLLEKGATIATIHLAVYMGDLAKIEAFIQEGSGINALDGHGYAPLHYAAQNNQKKAIELLLAKGADINVKNWPGQTPLDIAISQNRKDIVELLISKGADVNTTNVAGDTPLHYTVNSQSADKEIIELLITKGANLNAKNNKGQTPLDIALSRNQKDIVELLLAKGAEVSIHTAARLGDTDKVRDFLEKGADANTKDNNGWTALFHAATGGHKELVELLLTKGADANTKDNNGWTALHMAADNKHKDVAKLLIDKGADVNTKSNAGDTPLYCAFWNDDSEMAELLVTNGADVNFIPKDEDPTLHYAVWSKDVNTVKLLVDHGARFDVKDQDGWTSFRCAAAQGSRDILEFFVSKGADVSTLHMAACMGDLARVKSLLEQGADINTKDELGWTPIYWAASTGRTEVAELLIAKGADIQAKTNDEATPLHQASTSGSEELVKLLISKNADVNAKNKNGTTPLHNGASSGNRAIVELLLAKGANINAQNRDNWTPLHSAVIRGQKEIVEVLIAKGADVNAKNVQGRTPLQLAEDQKRTEIADLLRKYEAKKAEGASSSTNTPQGTPSQDRDSQDDKDAKGAPADPNGNRISEDTPHYE